ncbi:MAG: alpha-amylase [Myxococcales bacterium]|nr:alpha-amylase [Myxococcales bacterium]
MARPEHGTLYQIFARIWLDELSRAAGRRLTLAEVPDAELDALAARGFDWLYLLGVWTLGREGPPISRSLPELRRGYDEMLPGWSEADVVGSPFAVARYAVEPSLGGDAALASLRGRLAQRGIGLVLDFVPNHTARDHDWVRERPELYVRDASGAVACGRDPFFPPWTDTAQLDLRREATQAALVEALCAVAARADGARCDMAMLVLADVFARTWAALPELEPGAAAGGELWARALDAVRARHPDFLFIAEAYWDLEWRLQLLGFDYTYDKRLYDRLLHAPAEVRGHLAASADYQRRSVRFLENHDEPRIASLLDFERQRAAAVLAFTVPGLRFLHDGELDGRRVRSSVHLARRKVEPVDAARRAFYAQLLEVLRLPALRTGRFATLAPAGPDSLLAHRWDHPEGAVVVVVAFGPEAVGGRVALDLPGLAGRRVAVRDRLTGAVAVHDGAALVDPARGLPVELPAWGVAVLERVPS